MTSYLRHSLRARLDALHTETVRAEVRSVDADVCVTAKITHDSSLFYFVQNVIAYRCPFHGQSSARSGL